LPSRPSRPAVLEMAGNARSRTLREKLALVTDVDRLW
jgi:hypothetical protein